MDRTSPPDRRRRSAASVLAVVLLGALPVAAVIAVRAALVGPAEAIAERIHAADSPLVREVQVYPWGWKNMFNGKSSEIVVYVVDGTTAEQAVDLWCRVLLPAGAAQMGRYLSILKNPSNPIGVFPDGGIPTCERSPAPAAT